MITNGMQHHDPARSADPADSRAVSGYEITIRVASKDDASRLVTNLVRSDCYESIAGLRVAALVEDRSEPDELPQAG